MGSWCVVVPTVRPTEFVSFMEAWRPLFEKHEAYLIVLEDSPKKSQKVKTALKGLPHEHLCQKDVPDFIPVKTDMIRSWGFYRAWRLAQDVFGDFFIKYVLTLDDDVRPDDADIFHEYEREFEAGRPVGKYLSTGSLTSSRLEMRGYPYKDRLPKPVGVQYGGWRGVLDYDAATQLSQPRESEEWQVVNMAVPEGIPTTCCIMNCAFLVEHAPIMWQLPMLNGRYNRTGDIWSGLFQKKVLDGLGHAMVLNGWATVKHDRKSDPYNSLIKEAPGLKLNEHLWDNLDGVTFEAVTDNAWLFFDRHDKEYAKHFRKARDKWLALFR